MSGDALNSAHDTGPYPPTSDKSASGRGLSRPLKELIEWPSDEQFRTIARVLGLVEAVEQRLSRDYATVLEGEGYRVLERVS